MKKLLYSIIAATLTATTAITTTALAQSQRFFYDAYFEGDVFLADAPTTPLKDRLGVGTNGVPANVMTLDGSVIKPLSSQYVLRGGLRMSTNQVFSMTYKPEVTSARTNVVLDSVGELKLERFVDGTGWVSYTLTPTNRPLDVSKISDGTLPLVAGTNAAFTGTLTVGGATTITGATTIVGATTIGGAVTVSNNLTVASNVVASTFQASSIVIADPILEVGGVTVFDFDDVFGDNVLNVRTDLQVDGDVTVDGELKIGPFSISDPSISFNDVSVFDFDAIESDSKLFIGFGISVDGEAIASTFEFPSGSFLTSDGTNLFFVNTSGTTNAITSN
jgi:hypothetical protein